MGFQILRMQKMKNQISVMRSLKHSFREQETPNADANLLHHNTHIGASNTSEAMTKFNNLMPEKIRKNGILAVEFLITASPETMAELSRDEQDKYFDNALEWLKDKHGSENIFYAGIHRDETTPHMYAYVVPLDERGKLNHRKFYGGHRDTLSRVQTEFHEKVSKQYGMERGLEGSKAKHTRVKEFYSNLKKAEIGVEIESRDIQPKILQKRFFSKTVEDDRMVADRLNKKVKPLNDLANALKLEKRKRREAELSRDNLSKSNKKMRAQVRGISNKDIAELKIQKELARQKERALKKTQNRGFSH